MLANLYLNKLDWAVNDPQEPGRPVLVRYADDFVILCAPGQATELVGRLRRWLEARGLKLNEERPNWCIAGRGSTSWALRCAGNARE